MTTTIEKSNSAVSIFENERFGRIRVIDYEGQPWFVGREVALALGYVKPREALSTHCKGGRVLRLPSGGGEQDTKIIPEADVFRLIMRSKLPEAECFQDWVVEEVLPAIRRDGGYLHTTQEDDDHTIMIKACRILMAAKEKLEARLADVEPKAALADDYLVEGEEISIGDLAKKLGYEGINIGPHRLFELLRNKGVLISRPGVQFNTPTQKYASRGWFKIIQPPLSMLGKWKKQIRVTPKGVMEISKRMHELYGSDL